jgi:hypothetical protein
MQAKKTVYFTASLVGKKHFLEHYTRIISYLKSKNFDVISDHIINVTPEEVDHSSQDARIAFHTKLEKWIASCDFMVAEASFPSMSVGYEVSLAITRGKPIIILYSVGEPPALFAYHQNELLACVKYDLSTLPAILDDFVSYTQGVAETRFTFFITRELATYLDKVSKKNKVPKSVYLRQLIEHDMKSSS